MLRFWQGLGYNRRALMLHRAARIIVRRFGGAIPRSEEALKSLPGVGSYTASAVLTFAFDEPVTLIETNIRSVFLRHFFPNAWRVPDDRILPLVAATLDRAHPRRWYSALMDYGSILKRTGANPSRRSAHYVRQAPFRGSRREVRGVLLSFATRARSFSTARAIREVGRDARLVRACLAALTREGFLAARGGRFRLK